ncbi:hypothetical protein DWU98_01505 [Dyella monticola]|uniref:YfhO family protein n=2 Tax=Dyella monticola TaxID=1927958 RepID=A0A370X8S4_9GAMM|nr:hypothetical protein DWU98_01505 [Dyella monticola]
MLQPGNVRWLTHGDLAQSYLGWAFYRHAPWSWPLGSNPLYGAGLHTSIYYSDSIPLLAMVFKPLASWLPVPFQYFGLWVLACFVLQAWFAWRLLGLATCDALVKLLGVLFFVFAPPMLVRLAGHMALVGHWVVLAAIYLCLRTDRKRQTIGWTVLLAVAMMVHAYLFAIAAAIWVADVVHGYRTMLLAAPGVWASRLKTVLSQIWPVIVVALLAAWLAGLFMVSGHGTQAEGFGYYKMNVLAPINGDGWSTLGLNFPQAAGEYEGFNYFGAGGLAIMLSAAVISLMRRSAPRSLRLPVSLIVMAVLLAVTAITCNIGIGALQWHMPLPQKWWDALSRIPLQSTGRLFWVAYYVALLAALYVLLQVCSLRWQKVVLVCAAILQCVDIGSGLSSLHAMLSARAHDQAAWGLRGAFWDEAGQRYTMLSVLPLSKRNDWEQLAFYANSHRMGMDGVQLARIDMDGFLVRYNAGQQALLSDQLSERTLYVLDDREVAVARKAIPAQRAALFQLDGKNVLAPGWTSPLPAPAIDMRSTTSALSFELPFKSDFAPDGAGRLLLGRGWNATGEGLMSLSDAATVFVPSGDDAQRTLHVELDLHRANRGKSMAMGFEAWFEGKRIARCSMANSGCSSWRFDVPSAANDEYFRRIELRPDTPKAKLRIALDGVVVQ